MPHLGRCSYCGYGEHKFGTMKQILITITLLLTTSIVMAQEKKLIVPEHAREIMNALEGQFQWEIIRPSESKVLRTGTKISNYDLDSLILLSHEEFDSSSIRQVGLFGYNTVDSSFFTIGLYNISLNPKVRKGQLEEELNRIVFYENDSSRFFLNLVNYSHYYWTYENLKDDWEKRDLEIVFKRVDN